MRYEDGSPSSRIINDEHNKILTYIKIDLPVNILIIHKNMFL
jgi:hypothetical protein